MSIREVVIHPIFNRAYTCMEHPEGQLTSLGDALGGKKRLLEQSLPFTLRHCLNRRKKNLYFKRKRMLNR